jgi:hypothetical protein
LLLVPFNLDLDVGFGIEFGLEMDLDMDDVAGFVLRNFVLIKFILKKKTPNRPEFFFFFLSRSFPDGLGPQTVWKIMDGLDPNHPLKILDDLGSNHPELVADGLGPNRL